MMLAHAKVWRAVVVAMAGAGTALCAQQAKPLLNAPTAQPGAMTKAAAQGTGPRELVDRAQPFPKVNPANFTAATPTQDTVNAFLKQLWGYDTNREWSLQAIQKTQAEGVSRVVVFLADKREPAKQSETVFFVLPDGTHAIADNVIDFGATPFVADRQTLMERADGPARGARGKDLELVEFADLDCSKCKEAQTTIDQLSTDFPQARVVYQSLPASQDHAVAEQAAAEGECVRHDKGDAAFFTYLRAVYELQAALTPDKLAQTLATAATKAGSNATAMAICAATPTAKAAVAASAKLGVDLHVTTIPTLFVNGRSVPLVGVPYELLKRIVVFQAGEDGMKIPLRPSLENLR